ncbi:flavodoxin domain-containing protein [Brachybacterium sp. YJGR34]|uniref:flavodoxin domain-containing protein n=1 Tax=Brachybacterium sp. YJGR34 TaxID=2059911 RepID=UPI000E0AEFA8|nr:flavodoxin domain-containing protein [Brachybacterium sp. YJGR34]
MTVLVTYATHSGATATLAETLADTLRREGLEVELVDVAEAPDPAAADAVVLGSGVRVESVEKSARAWARTHHAVLAAKPFVFFSCSGSASDPAKQGRQKATDAFLAETALEPVAVKNLPGWVLMDRIPVHERVLLTSLRTPVGDFRDLPAVEAWAREIAPLLRS